MEPRYSEPLNVDTSFLQMFCSSRDCIPLVLGL